MTYTRPHKAQPRPVFETGRGVELNDGLSDRVVALYHESPVWEVPLKEFQQWIVSGQEAHVQPRIAA